MLVGWLSLGRLLPGRFATVMTQLWTLSAHGPILKSGRPLILVEGLVPGAVVNWPNGQAWAVC